MLINGFRLSFNRSHAFRSVNEGLGNKDGQRGNQEDHRDTRERSANAVKAFPWLQQPTWKQSERWWLSSLALLGSRVLVTTVCLKLFYLMLRPLSVFLSVTHTCRVSVVRVKGWPLFIQACRWGLITHTYCFALWPSIMAQLTAWKTRGRV